MDAQEIRPFSIVVALDRLSGGIGHDGSLPWRIPEDLSWFRKQTQGGVLIMGRVTWESMGARQLRGRVIIVVTGGGTATSSTTLCAPSLDAALRLTVSQPELRARPVFVVGGERIYRDALAMSQCTEVLATLVDSVGSSTQPYDRFFPGELFDTSRWTRTQCELCDTASFSGITRHDGRVVTGVPSRFVRAEAPKDPRALRVSHPFWTA